MLGAFSLIPNHPLDQAAILYPFPPLCGWEGGERRKEEEGGWWKKGGGGRREGGEREEEVGGKKEGKKVEGGMGERAEYRKGKETGMTKGEGVML